MALEHAILVSLRERAASGYDLTRRFGKSIGYFWSATHQQIYKVLKRMLEDGWVEVEHVAQAGKPDKKVYSVTAEGRRELKAWLGSPTAPADLRDELAVKLRGAAFGDPKALRREFARHRGHHADRLATYQAIQDADFPDPSALGGRALHQYLVLRGGIAVTQGFLAWCDEVLSALEES